MNTAAVHATRTGSDFVQKKPRYVFLALALFLLPFHRNLLGWNLLPAAPIVTAFASVYLKVSDAALLLSLCLF
jgi:hypothetical protein